MIDAVLQRRFLYILHRGLVEVRLLSGAGRHQQAFDLADAPETLPAWMQDWQEAYLCELRLNLKTYATKYPDAFDYFGILDGNADGAF